MGPEHESDPLISSRTDEPVSDASEPSDPGVGEPERGSGSVTPTEDVANTDPGAGSRPTESRPRGESPNMLPTRKARGHAERTFVRVIATGGIVGICVAIAAIMSSSNSQGWVIGLVVSLVSVVLAAVLWSSRIL